jgi:hypothetical protein
MRFAVRSFAAAVLAMGIVIALCSGISCATPSPATKLATQANRLPIVLQINGAPDWAPLTDGQFTCIASDPDGDNMTYKWTADNGTISGNGATVTWMSPAVMGEYYIGVTVSDGQGGEATGVKQARVVVNADGSVSADAPIVLKMSLPSKEVVTGAKRVRIWTATPVECTVDGTDVKNLRFTWSAASGKLQAAKGMNLNDGTASKVNWIAPGVGGDFTVDVVVTDGSGNEARGTVNFKVFCCGN